MAESGQVPGLPFLGSMFSGCIFQTVLFQTVLFEVCPASLRVYCIVNCIFQIFPDVLLRLVSKVANLQKQAGGWIDQLA